MTVQAPSGPVQQIPAGLLGFLQLKNVGRNPSNLADVYQPTMDLQRWLLDTNSIELRAQATPITALGEAALVRITGPAPVVPAGAWWWVAQAGWIMEGTNTGNTAQLILRNPSAGAAPTYYSFSGKNTSTAVGSFDAVECESGVFLAPGTEIRVFCNGFAANFDVIFSARVTPLPI